MRHIGTIVRLAGTVVASAFFYLSLTLYNVFLPIMEARIAIWQVSDSVVSYGLAQAFMSSHLGRPLLYGFLGIILVVIWWESLVALIKGASKDHQP